MKYQFTSSACGPAFYVPLSEIERVDITFESLSNVGGNKRRVNNISNNLDLLSDTFKNQIGVSREEFHMGKETLSLTKSRIVRGLGYER